MVVLVWVYYSAQIFLFGAEITRAYSVRRGSRRDLAPVMAHANHRGAPRQTEQVAKSEATMPANADRSVGTAPARPTAFGGEIVGWIVLSSLITLLVTRILRRGD
jgi:membrane protein